MTHYFEKKGDGRAVNRKSEQQQLPQQKKWQEKLYIPRIMAEMMLATTANTTSIHFGMGHQCHKHDRLYTLDHICECDALVECGKVREYANKLKEKHILDWEKDERTHAIYTFAQLTV